MDEPVSLSADQREATTDDRDEWEQYDRDRALWLSRLMFGWMHPDPEMRRMMDAGNPPEPPR